MNEKKKKYLDNHCHVNLYKGDENLIGWYVEYYLAEGAKSKYIGMVTVSQPDRKYVGYSGRQSQSSDELPAILNKKAYNGVEITSILYPIYK